MQTRNRYARIIFIGTVILLMLACNLPSNQGNQGNQNNQDNQANIPLMGSNNSVAPSVMPQDPAAISQTQPLSVAGKDGSVLVYVPKGDFTMGNDANNALAECQKFRKDCKLEWFLREAPPHVVTLDAFWIDQTEVTNAMYAKCVNEGICKEPVNTSSITHSSYYGNPEFNNYPVLYVNWDMANTYCSWAGLRLPTEAEWEKAARGTDERTYPWGNDAPNTNLLNYDSNVGDVTTTGHYEAGKSIYSAYDMAGNVMEWVNDWYSETYYQSSPALNPLGPGPGQYHVLRGGAWGDIFLAIRTVNRNRGSYTPDSAYVNVGFRCARPEGEMKAVIIETQTIPKILAPIDPIARSPGGGAGDCPNGYLEDSVYGCALPKPSDPIIAFSAGGTPTLTPTATGNRCSLFNERNIKLVMLDWVPNTPLNFYLKITGGVPGLEDKTVDDGKPWNYSVKIGEYITEKCAPIAGYKERLYCSIKLPSNYSFTLRPITLTVNGCETPIYQNPIEEIPPMITITPVKKPPVATDPPVIDTTGTPSDG